MDCARLLALEPSELDKTDTADRALEALHGSSIRKVYIAGRRGPEHAAFTAPELRELSHLEHTDVYFDGEGISAAIERASAGGQIEKHVGSVRLEDECLRRLVRRLVMCPASWA